MTVTRVAESRTEFKLKSLPEDAISSVKFAPKSNQFLLLSSWDCSVRLYDVVANVERHKYNHELPVLDVCFRVCQAEIVLLSTSKTYWFRLIHEYLLVYRMLFTLIAEVLTNRLRCMTWMLVLRRCWGSIKVLYVAWSSPLKWTPCWRAAGTEQSKCGTVEYPTV